MIKKKISPGRYAGNNDIFYFGLISFFTSRYTPKSTLTINGVVDFGTTVADGQVFTKEIAILNHGSKCGDYKILLDPNLPFHIMPVQGTIHPGYSQPIRVRLSSQLATLGLLKTY